MKDRAILFAPMILIFALTCASAYAAPQAIVLKDKDKYVAVVTDCPATKVLKVSGKKLRENSSIEITTPDSKLNCRIKEIIPLIT